MSKLEQMRERAKKIIEERENDPDYQKHKKSKKSKTRKPKKSKGCH